MIEQKHGKKDCAALHRVQGNRRAAPGPLMRTSQVVTLNAVNGSPNRQVGQGR